MNIFIINTPYHLFISSNLMKKEDFLIIIDDFNIETSQFCQLLIKSKLSPDRIIKLQGLRTYRKKPLKMLNFVLNTSRAIKKIDKKAIDNLYICNDGNPINQLLISKLTPKSEVILFEEGIGLYRDVKKRFHIFYDIIGKFIFGIGFQNIKRLGEYKKTTNIVCNFPECLSNRQLEKKISNLEITKENLEGLKNIVNKNYYIPDSKFDLFISQPLVEDGVMDEKEYLGKLEEIIRRVSRKGYNFYIKPHPREVINKYKYLEEKYNIMLLKEKDIPIEILLLNQGDTHIYTVYSSAVFNIARYLNLETFLLYEIFSINPHIPSELLNFPKINVVDSIENMVSIKGKLRNEY